MRWLNLLVYLNIYVSNSGIVATILIKRQIGYLDSGLYTGWLKAEDDFDDTQLRRSRQT